jgi:hypothetical protein
MHRDISPLVRFGFIEPAKACQQDASVMQRVLEIGGEDEGAVVVGKGSVQVP